MDEAKLHPVKKNKLSFIRHERHPCPMLSILSAVLSGFVLCATLIVAIGAQNMFVLRQGLQRSHVGPIVMFCGMADTLLVSAGVAGAGSLLALLPGLSIALTLGGAAFLAHHGAAALRRAAQASSFEIGQVAALPLGRTLAATAAFTLLNPHVYLDTVLLMGAAGGHQPAALRAFFVLGASAASFGWFALIGFGARGLAPIFAKPGTWRILDALIGCTMLALALRLLLDLFAR